MSLQALERKKEGQWHLHEENQRINTETIRIKEQQREEEKLLDMRDMEYIKKKLVKQNTRADSLQVIHRAHICHLCRSKRQNMKQSKNE